MPYVQDETEVWFSDGYSVKDIKYHWNSGSGSPVGIDDTVQLPQFKVRGHQTLEKIATTSTGIRFVCNRFSR